MIVNNGESCLEVSLLDSYIGSASSISLGYAFLLFANGGKKVKIKRGLEKVKFS